MIKKLYLIIMLSLTIFGTVFSTAQPAYAACSSSFLAIPAWYKGMQDPTTCAFKAPVNKAGQSDAKVMVMRIAGNIIQAAMVIVAYVTIFFLIKGGFAYIASAGSSEGMASAKKTITNSIIGLIIAVLAASIVNAIGGAIK